MARREENWRRRREEEEDEEREYASRKRSGDDDDPSDSDRIRHLIEKSEPLIDQLNNLYNMFAAGIEKIPPIERRKQLDQTMATLLAMGKPTPSLRFQASAVQAKYTAFCERWDRLLKGLESGKRKRALKNKKKQSP
jgi:hypothetical protein